jgi:hypothetical protein
MRETTFQSCLRIAPAPPLLVSFLLLASAASGQQTYVSRYNAYFGYAYLKSPNVDLNENGFHLQVGYDARTWLAMGFDYSISSGDLTLTPNLLPTALQQQLAGVLAQLAAAGELPPNYTLAVPSHSKTQTFAAGPQLEFRHFTHVTFFVRPSLGAIHETATTEPADPIATLIVQQLAPSGKKQDWQGFYGGGGGLDISVSKHFALRMQVDVVYDHLFNDILKDGRRTIRFSVGPSFNFGKNIVQ